MKLNEFKSLLIQHAEKPFRLRLPNGHPVPQSFHITEVGRLRKTFIDCGGAMHESETCQLQVWVGEDGEHRIQVSKMIAILRRAESFIPEDSVPLEIEYEDTVISQYTIEGHAIEADAMVLHLAPKHTQCLAMELCGTPKKEPAEAESACCSGSGCC